MTTNSDNHDDGDWDDFETSEDGGSDLNNEESIETEGAKTEPEIEMDPEDPVQFPDQFYKVQQNYQHEGETIEAGTDIQIKCGNCAAWDAPLKAREDKPLCRPGLPFLLPSQDGEEPQRWRMQEDRYSCQTHFIPKDMEDVLQFFTGDLDQIRMLLWSFPVLVRFVKLQQRIIKHHEKNGGDAEKSINTVIDFMVLFSSEEQMKLVKPFVKRIADGLVETRRTKKKKKTRKRTAFRPGDEVSWQTEAGKEVRGFIRTIGGRNKNVTIIVTAPYVEVLTPGAEQNAIQWQRPVAEWKQMNPQKVAATPVMTDQQDG